jgi:DNA adenine methylase
VARPFIRSAGGKRKLAPEILALFPPKFDAYVEPFVGAGAVFFALEAEGRLPGITILGDVNADLINLYAAARHHPEQLIAEASAHIGAARALGYESYYNGQRLLWNKGARSPARQLYLRHACFNGLWRTNRAGEMNVSWRKDAPIPIDTDNLLAASHALRKAQLVDWSYSAHDLYVCPDMVLYLDPPYVNEAGGFSAYTPGGWKEPDLITLFKDCRRWSEDDGAHVILSHADTPRTRELLAEYWPKSIKSTTTAHRFINSDGFGRDPVSELIVYSRLP